MDGTADVAETSYIPFGSEPDAGQVGLIVHRVRPTPSSQMAPFASYSYHAFITDRGGDTLQLEADHRRHAEIENAIRDLKYGVELNHLPSGRFAANAVWLAVQDPAPYSIRDHHSQPRSLERTHSSGRAGGDHRDTQAPLFLTPRTAHTLGAPTHLAAPVVLALG